MDIGNYQEPTEFVQRVLTVGKIKFTPIAVNPTKDELQKLRDSGLGVWVPDEEPVYFGKAPINRENPDKQVDYFDITIYLRNRAFPENVDRINYRVMNSGKKSSTGKVLVINAYGSTTWLEDSYLKSKSTPSNMDWYVTDDMKACRIGEDSLIAFIRALRNLKNISQDTADKQNFRSIFGDKDIKAMMSGNFGGIKKVILEVEDANVVFVTGIRTYEGKKYQDLYHRLPLRSYVADSTGSDDFIVKTIDDSQKAGASANTNFFLNNLQGREYIETSGDMPMEDDSSFNFGSDMDMSEEDDELPF